MDQRIQPTIGGNMSCRPKVIFLAGVLAWSGTAAGRCRNTTGGARAISLKLVPVKDSFAVGAPVRVRVVMTNQSNHNISIWRDNDGNAQYGIDVRDAQGKLAKDTKYGIYHNGHVDLSKLDVRDMDTHYLDRSGGCVTLKAGESLRDPVNVSRPYALSEPGKYTIQVRERDPSGTI